MATATRKSRASKQFPRPAAQPNAPAAMEFLIYEDNGGAYHWRIRGHDNATLAQSGKAASYDDAAQAAQRVRDGAAEARLDRGAIEEVPLDLTARRGTPSDDSDAERWFDEGGSFSSQAVAKWPSPR